MSYDQSMPFCAQHDNSTSLPYEQPMNYRLLKDLPDVKAGAILTWDEPSRQYVINKDDYPLPPRPITYCFSEAMVERNPDWFAPVQNTLDSIVEEEWENATPLGFSKPLEQDLKKFAKYACEKYLAIFKQSLIEKLNHWKEEENANQNQNYNLGINRAISLINE